MEVITKGTDSVMLGDPIYKDDNARITTVPLKPFTEKMWKIPSFFWLELCLFLWVSCKKGNAQVTFAGYRNENKQFKETKTLMSNSYLIRQRLQGQGTVVNREYSSLKKRSLKITLTVPFNTIKNRRDLLQYSSKKSFVSSVFLFEYILTRNYVNSPFKIFQVWIILFLMIKNNNGSSFRFKMLLTL